MAKSSSPIMMPFNRLLEYRPRAFLERMTDAERADLLREVLQGGQSEQTWLALFELFACWPDSKSKFDLLEVAEQELVSWDDRLRFAPSSSRALYDGTRLSSVARLVRSIRIYRRGDSGRAELLALVASREAARLTRLNIVDSEIADAWQALVRSPNLTNLRHLHVTSTVMDGDIFLQLLQSAGLPELRCLKLVEVGITAIWLRGMLHMAPTLRLETIDFTRNSVLDEGARFLSESPLLQSVQHLTLRYNCIEEPGMRALLSSPHALQLKSLDLSNNEATDEERRALKELAESKQVRLTI